MATRCKEMEAEYFVSHPRAAYGGPKSSVPSTHKHGSFTTIPSATTSFRSTGGLQCDLCMGATRHSHAHEVFDGRSRVSLGQGSGGMTHGGWNNSLETGQSSCVQSKSINPSDQRSRWRHGYQVFHEMPHSNSGHEQAQGRYCMVPAASQDLYHSYRRTSHAGVESELISRESGSDTHQLFETMPHIPKRVLSVQIHNMIYPVTSDVLYQVFSAYGAVEIIPITSSMGDRVLIQYQHEQMAEKAHKLLHGRYIYESCCQLDIRYAHKAELEILHPFQCTAHPSLDTGNTSEENYAPVCPSRSVVDMPCPQVIDHSSSTSLNQGTDVEEQQHVTLHTVSTFLAEWRAEMEQMERSRIEQAELKTELEYFLHHAFDIFEEEYESDVVLEMEMENKIKEEQVRFEQEELERELDHFLYQAFDLFGEELESVLERQNDKIPVEHGVGTVVGLICGSDPTSKYVVSQEYLKLNSQPSSDFASIVDFSFSHVLAKQMENKKLNHVGNITLQWDPGSHGINKIYISFLLKLVEGYIEPTMQWEPGDQEVGSRLMKLTVESQLLRREEILGIPNLQLNKHYQGGGKSKSKKLTLPWDPGEQENIFIFARTECSGSATASTAPVKSCGEDFTVLVLRIINMGSVSGKNGSIFMQARISSKLIVIVFLCQEDDWVSHFTQGLFLPETKGTCDIIAVAVIRRGVMLNSYNSEVLVRALSFSATSVCQLWTKRLHSEVAVMCVKTWSVFLAAHILAMSAHISEKFQQHKSNTCFSFKQNQPGIYFYNQLDHRIRDLCISASFCKIMDKFHLTCQDTMVASDGSNVQITQHYSYGEVLRLEDVISMLPPEIIMRLTDLGEKLAGSNKHMYKVKRQTCATQCAASNYFGLLLKKDSGFSWGDFSLQIRTTWQWDPGTVTSSRTVLKQGIWAMDIHLKFYQSVLSPEIEYLLQSVALCSGDSSMQVRNYLSWTKLSPEVKTEWQGYAGIVASSHAVLKLNIWSKGTHFETSQMQATKSWLYCPGKIFIVDISLWRNTMVAAELKQPYLTLKLCYSCHQQFPRAINPLSPLQPFKRYSPSYGIEVWILSFLPP